MHGGGTRAHRALALSRQHGVVRIEQQLREVAPVDRRAAAEPGDYARDHQLCGARAVVVTTGAIGERQTPVTAVMLDSQAVLVARACADARALRDLYGEALHRAPSPVPGREGEGAACAASRLRTCAS